MKIILFEKPEKQYYEEIAVGECEPGVSTVVRHILKQHQSDYQTVAQFTGVTTAKGRQQAKMLFKRKVQR